MLLRLVTVPYLPIQSKVIQRIDVSAHVRIHRHRRAGVSHALVHLSSLTIGIVHYRAIGRVSHPELILGITESLPTGHANEILHGKIVRDGPVHAR